MSAGFDVNFFKEEGGEKPTECGVVSIYEDLGARDILLRLCDSLAHKFDGDLDFRFDWWRFKYLADPEVAMEAAVTATRADLILLAPKSSNLPGFVESWFDGWLRHRDAGDGALVVVQPSAMDATRAFQCPSNLRVSAKRAHLDYFRLNASGLTIPLPGDVGAVALTQLEMDELFADDNRPTHWGINE